jgi:hypothetical protein
MSSIQKKRGSSPGTPHDKTPSKRSKTGKASGGRPSKAVNFVPAEDAALCNRQGLWQEAFQAVNVVPAEDAALCKAYVNVTLNPIDGVGKKASTFWDHIHRKYCLMLKQDNSSEALPDRDSESLKNRFQAFAFINCVEVLHQLPKFNPMIDDADRSSDVVAEDSNADKKPAASVNKIGAPMGASLKRPPGSEKSKEGVAFQRLKLVWINCCFCCHGDDGRESFCNGYSSK